MLRRTRVLRREEIDSLTKGMVSEGAREVTRDGASARDGVRVFRSADLRYAGQSHELTLPVGPNLAQSFHRLHERAYGYSRPGDEMELVTLRVRVEGPAPKLDWKKVFGPSRLSSVPRDLKPGRRRSPERVLRCLPRSSLPPRTRLSGPILVEEYSATTYVAEGFDLRVGDLGELVIDDRAGIRP